MIEKRILVVGFWGGDGVRIFFLKKKDVLRGFCKRVWWWINECVSKVNGCWMSWWRWE